MRFPRLPVTTVDSPGAKSAARQLAEMVLWGSRLIATPNDYKTHRFYLKGKTISDAEQYLSGMRSFPLLSALNPEHELLLDKLEFEKHFRSRGLSVAQTLATIGGPGNEGVTNLVDAAELTAFIAARLADGVQLVVKPRFGVGGSHVSVITGITGEEGGERLTLSLGADVSAEELASKLTSSGGQWLIQERIKQHPLLDTINSSSLNTCRVATFRRENGQIDVDYAVLRIGRPRASVDGFSAGGVVVPIDPKTGRFSAKGVQKAKHSVEDFPRHPDSGVEFAGLTMPHWEATLEMARSFARAAGANRYIGWDVASTEAGPVIVEGNHNWDTQLAQAGSKGLLTDEWLARLHDEAGMKVERRPAPRLRTAYRLVRQNL